MNPNINRAKSLLCQAAKAGGMAQQDALDDLQAMQRTGSTGAAFASFFAEKQINNQMPSGKKQGQQVMSAMQIQYVAIRDLTAAVIRLAEQGSDAVTDALLKLQQAVDAFRIQALAPDHASTKMHGVQRSERKPRKDWQTIKARFYELRKANPQLSIKGIAAKLTKEGLDVSDTALGRKVAEWEK